VLGVAGGFLVMMAQGFPFAALWNQLVSAVGVSDVMTGMIKSFVFGILVAGVGCLRGLQTGNGATAVGESTTRAVVSGIFLIVLVDAVFAGIFYVLKW
jgi:phospholipid/cholesterol/gamma-HCH transport system permease protein